jgi:hypothetical protein
MKTNIEELKAAIEADCKDIDAVFKLRQAAQELIELRENNGWLPIETAPKDGTRILISNGKDIGHAYYNRGYFTVVASNDRIRIEDITHFQYLPTPPKGEN